MERVIVHLARDKHAAASQYYFGTDITIGSHIPSRRRNEFGVVAKLLFQFGIRALFAYATCVRVGVVVVRIVVVAITSVVDFGICVIGKVVGSARILFPVILAGRGE